jgi:hypothetical protein
MVEQIIELATLQGWRVTHFRPAWTAKGYRTAIAGHAGFPDLVLARDGDVLMWEVKGPRGIVSPPQRKWLTELGNMAAVIRPDDWEFVQDRLTRRRAVLASQQ